MSEAYLGILDSGLGGLAVSQAIWQELPNESTLYLADHRFFPYSKKSLPVINRRLVELTNFFSQQSVKAVILACNTISTSSLNFLRKLYPLPFIGTVPAIKPAIEANLKENILVLATPRTSTSKSLKTMIKQLDQRGQVRVLACPGLAEAIEAHACQPVQLEKILRQTLARVQFYFSALVLGCTHYLLVKDIFQKILPASVILIDPSQAISQQTAKILSQKQLLASGPAQHVFLTTGQAKQVSKNASSLLKKSIIFKQCSL